MVTLSFNLLLLKCMAIEDLKEKEPTLNANSLPQIKPTQDVSSIDVNSSVPGQQQPSPDSSAINLTEQPKSRLGFLRSKKFIIILILILIIGAASGGIFYFLNQKVTAYTLIPDDTQFYLGLSVKKHPQVQKLLALSKKLPGGEKMVKYIDDYRQEIFGTRKDPFKEILNLADQEIFLAKISPDEQEQGRFAINTLEKLVNIVEFKDSKAAKSKLSKVQSEENVITTTEAYGSAKIAKFELKTQGKDERTQQFDTGALPYQVTLPLSKSVFATDINKFIVAAEKENDVKKIIDLATDAKKKKLKSIEADEEHNEVASHFPNEYLLKFYQRRVLDPFSNITPGTTLPQTFLLGQSYDTRERSSEGTNVYTTKRGLTVVAQDNGVDFTSYQLTDKSRFQEGLKHGFTFENSLASKIPSKLNSNNLLFYGEMKNLKGAIQDQLDQLEDVAKNSSDEQQRKSFERSLEDIKETKKKINELFNVNVDEDLLSWMDQNAAVLVTAGTGGKPPEILFLFEIKDQSLVESKLSKFKMVDFFKQREDQSKTARVKNDIGSLATELQAYYTSPGQGKYPQNLVELTQIQGGLKTLPKTPSGENYGYLVCDNRAEVTVFGKQEDTGTYWAWNSVTGRAEDTGQASPPTNCNFNVNYNYGRASEVERTYPRIDAKIDTYNNKNIYSFPVYDWKGDSFALRLTTTNQLAVISFASSDTTIKELIDLSGPATNPISSDQRWQEQFARAPKIVGGIVYIVPESVMGIVDYFLSKEPEYKEYYAKEDYLTIIGGYLKALKSIGTTTTQESKTLISNTFVNIESIGADESKRVEEALDRLFSKTGDVGQRTTQARDAMIKNDIGSLATRLQAYYTSPGKGFYPNVLTDLVASGELRAIPTTPSGEDYGYLRCAGGKEAAVFAKLETTGTYWVWSSVSMKAMDIKSSTRPSTTCVYGL